MDDENIKHFSEINVASSENLKEHDQESSDSCLNSMEQKRQELECIQNDLTDLMFRLSNFIADSQDFYDSDEMDDFNNDANEFGDGNSENKKDIGNEKYGYMSVHDYYISDGINPPEINWNILGPYIQSIVSDLRKLRNLNFLTNNVMCRIRSVTEDITMPVMHEDELDMEECGKDVDEREEDENDG